MYAKAAERKEPAAKRAARQRLAHWQEDADLASVRDRAPLDRLPEDERKEWRQLWDDVAALLKTGARVLSGSRGVSRGATLPKLSPRGEHT